MHVTSGHQHPNRRTLMIIMEDKRDAKEDQYHQVSSRLMLKSVRFAPKTSAHEGFVLEEIKNDGQVINQRPLFLG